MGSTHSRSFLFLLLVVFLYLQFFHQLGRLGLVGPDEPRYAQVAKEMAASGDLITPHLYGRPWFEKPILYYWLAAFSYKAFGVSEFAARLPSALAAMLGCLAVFLIGRSWISFRGGFIAALILAASPLYFSLARAASTDMLLTGMFTLSLTGLYFALFSQAQSTQSGSPTPGQTSSSGIYVFYGCLALAVLAKGPIGALLAGASLALFILLTRQYGLTARLQLLRGVLLFAALAVPWYLLCYRVNGSPFLQEFFVDHNLARFATDRFQHSQPFWFYPAVLFAGFFPWTFQLFRPAWHFLRKARQSSKGNRFELFLWIWVGVPLLFFSLSKSKLPAYISPIFPALALLAAREWNELWKLGRHTPSSWSFPWAAFVQAGFILTLGLVLPIGVERLNLEVKAFLLPLTALLCGVGGCGLLLVRRRQWRSLFGIYLAGVGLMVTLILHRIIPELDPLESSRQLAAALKKQGYSGEPIFIYRLSRRVEYGLNFYLNTEAKIIYSEGDLDYPNQGSFFLITTPSVDIDLLLPRGKAEHETSFHHQQIAKMSRR
jgi:4-amino-4-deoxy-L-arabinose transferase-like glycosyltransferase